MGREVRRVKKGWEHPKKEDYPEQYQPMFDESYDEACQKWYYECVKSGGKHIGSDGETYWHHDWVGNPPDEKYYRSETWTEDEKDHYQMYETVSEGTPLSPVFATKEELVNFLCTEGDFWHKKPWTRKNAESFVEIGFALSGIMANGRIYEPHEQGELNNGIR